MQGFQTAYSVEIGRVNLHIDWLHLDKMLFGSLD